MKTVVMSAVLAAWALAPAEAAAQEADGPAFMEDAVCYALPLALEPALRDRFCDATTGQLPLTERLGRLEAVIGELPASNPASAMARAMKAQILVALGRRDEALADIRATMRAFPRLPVLWIGAIEVFAFTEHAGAAADFWIELADFNPAAARAIEDYYWITLGPQLGSTGQWAKEKELAAALESIGYDGGSEAGRSLLAEVLFHAAMERGNLAGARVQLERISDPDSLLDILRNQRLSAVWEQNPWSDPSRRAPILRRWVDDLGRAATADGLQAGIFIRTVASHAGPDQVTAAYEPVLRAQMAKGAAGLEDFDFSFWLSPLATAHVIAGRPERADALYRDAVGYFATLDSPVRLNATSNYALVLQRQGRNAEAVPLIDESIEALDAAGGINGALLQMHAVRVLALEGLGRSREAEESLRVLAANRTVSFPSYVDTLLALGRYREARTALVEILEGNNYMLGVRLLQPSFAAFESPFDRDVRERRTRLAQDRRVRRALQGKGRVLGYEPVRLDPIALPDLAPGLLPD